MFALVVVALFLFVRHFSGGGDIISFYKKTLPLHPKLFVMKTMSHTERTIVEAYSVLLDNLSDVCKTALMEYLSKTMKSSEKTQNVENGFALSFGAWEGAEQTIDEIKAEIKNSRNFRKKEAILD